MRSFAIVALMILVSSAAIAQTPTAPTTPSAPPPTMAPPPAPAEPPAATAATAPAPEGISRDDYIAKARDVAGKRAATRFDEMDANHDGILTKQEIAAYRAVHSRKAPAEPQ
jgi:hypothetical protein